MKPEQVTLDELTYNFLFGLPSHFMDGGSFIKGWHKYITHYNEHTNDGVWKQIKALMLVATETLNDNPRP
jgi:hypothetical protein